LSSSLNGGEPFRATPFTNKELAVVFSEDGAAEGAKLATFPTSCPQNIPI